MRLSSSAPHRTAPHRDRDRDRDREKEKDHAVMALKCIGTRDATFDS